MPELEGVPDRPVGVDDDRLVRAWSRLPGRKFVHTNGDADYAWRVLDRLGIAERLARCLEDPRAPERTQHTLAEMIRFRALLIAAGYPDANDCDGLRIDPAFKMAVGRLPESGEDLCSQPTMCRLENLPGPVALKRLMAAMVELFCDMTPAEASAAVRPASPGG